MSDKLPEIFLQQMQAMLPPSEFAAFCDTYESPTVRGLRLNKLKFPCGMTPPLRDILPDVGTRTNPTGSCKGGADSTESIVPWCTEGRYYPETARPGKSIFFHAGLFYIQEPSAMCPVEVLQPQPGDFVLDLCAAPGGKSAQIAGHMQGQGLLMANDASPTRCRALVHNLERMGVTNAVVTTELPKKLADRFSEFFDKILVDAPCSGEGMFRRDPDAVKAYTANKPEACAAMQTEILRYAAKMLKPGGRLVYSTCTFNMKENENVICDFLKNHSDFAAIEIDHAALGISRGFEPLPQAGRIFPHLAQGEGHFVVLLERQRGVTSPENTAPRNCKPKETPRQARNDGLANFTTFCDHFLTTPLPPGVIVPHGVNLYLQPTPLDLHGLRVARSGWYLGENAKGRFVPSQALAMGLRKQDVRHSVELSEENALRYLRGESLDANDIQIPDKPWIMLCYMGFPLGWARLVQGRLKSNLPVGWAIT